MLEAFFLPFSAIFLAELLDKSQLTVLFLATKTKKHLELLSGILLAFIIVDGAAVFFGSLITAFLPENIIRIAAGSLFMLFGILSLRPAHTDSKQRIQLQNPFVSGFVLVFFSEWGDKTQIASGVFAAKYPSLPVFLGVISALTLLSLMAVTVGSVLLSKINKRVVSLISGIIFVLLGVLFLLS